MDQRLWESFLQDWTALSAYSSPMQRGQLIQQAAALLRQARHDLLPLLETGTNRALETALLQAFQAWEDRLQHLGKEVPATLDHQLFILEIQLSLLQPLAVVAEGKPWDEHHHLLSALKSLEYRLGTAVPPESHGMARLHQLRLRLIDEQLEAFAKACQVEEGRVVKPLSEIHILWRQVRHGESLLLSLLHELLILHGESPFLGLLEKRRRVAPDLPRELQRAVQNLQDLAQRIDALVGRLIQAIQGLSLKQSRRWLGQHYREMSDFAAELTSQDDDRFPLLEAFASYRAYGHLRRFHEAIAQDPTRRPWLDLRGLRHLTKGSGRTGWREPFP